MELIAVKSRQDNYTIAYAKALVSRVDLPNAKDKAATVSGNLVSFTWTDNSGFGKAEATDNAVLVAYALSRSKRCSAT